MVHFVGAGCGAKDLITVRGKQRIEEAEVLIYAGSLINPALLSYAKQSCVVYDSATMTLDEVIGRMEEAEKQHLTTVRLHSGDPSLYGAIKEQMDALDSKGISYDVCPGVTAAFGAAASLRTEYTLPGVTQTLIFTRMSGKTKVPEAEAIASLAAHRASMAVYLSSTLTKELQEELLRGGYPEETPAVICYKASWPEEQNIRCTVGTLHETALREQIRKTALILVGDALSPADYETSRLYDANFETEYRYNKNVLSIISFTRTGAALSQTLAERLHGTLELQEGTPSEIRLYTKCKTVSGISYVEDAIAQFAAGEMRKHHALLFVGAAGIAVRAIAFAVRDKLSDAPVLVMDETGAFCIPLLSGHVGGANALASQIASLTGATAVITTATDLQGVFAVDLFAKKNHLVIQNKDGIAKVSAKALRTEPLRIAVDSRRVKGTVPEGIVVVSESMTAGAEPGSVDVRITESLHPEHKEDTLLTLFARPFVIGAGCRRGTTPENFRQFVEAALAESGITLSEVLAVASIDLKENEECLTSFCDKEGLTFLTYSADRLNAVTGSFSESGFVKETTGTGNVCERAAVCVLEEAGEKGDLILHKKAIDGMTIAIAKREWTVSF